MAGVASISGNNPINLSVIIIAMNEGECMQFHKMHYKLYGNSQVGDLPCRRNACSLLMQTISSEMQYCWLCFVNKIFVSGIAVLRRNHLKHLSNLHLHIVIIVNFWEFVYICNMIKSVILRYICILYIVIIQITSVGWLYIDVRFRLYHSLYWIIGLSRI